MTRRRVGTVPRGTRVLWAGRWWLVSESAIGEVLLVCEQHRHIMQWLPSEWRVGVDLRASREVSPC